MNDRYHGSCYCGATKATVSGDPVSAAYCHCHSCRKWHAAPINAWAAWPTASVTISGETITSSHNNESRRISCANCGGCVANGKPTPDLMVVYPMTLAESGWNFKPGFHMFYEERVMDVNDRLPKFVDAPKEFGFSGKLIDEPAISELKT